MWSVEVGRRRSASVSGVASVVACVARAPRASVASFPYGGNAPAIFIAVMAGTGLPATTNGTIPTYWIPVEADFVIHFVIWPF